MDVITLNTAPQPTFDYGLLFIISLSVVIYFYFIIKPQKKRQEAQMNFLKNLKKGDKVATIGGLRGIIYEVDEDTVVLEVDKHGHKLTVFKVAIVEESFMKLDKK